MYFELQSDVPQIDLTETICNGGRKVTPFKLQAKAIKELKNARHLNLPQSNKIVTKEELDCLVRKFK